MAQKNRQQLNLSYDREGDVLDLSLGSPSKAISREIADDFFIRLDPKTQEVVGFMMLNFQHRFQKNHHVASIPISGHFELSQKFAV